MNFKSYQHWSELPSNVDLLFKQGADDSMFLTREWFETLSATTIKDSQTLLLACVEKNGIVLALLPLIGSTENKDSLSHRYTAFYSVLFMDENQNEILSCLAFGLSQMSIHSLALSPMADDDKLLILKEVLADQGYAFHKKFFFYNWIHRTKQQSFKEYMAERPSQLRNTIKRKCRKLEREHGYDIRMFKGEEVGQGLIDYHAPYTASWKANEQYLELLDATAMNLSIPNWTRLAVLYVDGTAVAAQLWFVVQRKASIFRLAYDEAWKQYSPGSILTTYLMEYVIDNDQVEEIDFLTGNERYKQDWMSERRERFRVLFIKEAKKESKFGMVMALIKRLFLK